MALQVILKSTLTANFFQNYETPQVLRWKQRSYQYQILLHQLDYIAVVHLLFN